VRACDGVRELEAHEEESAKQEFTDINAKRAAASNALGIVIVLV
jgi:hypothetical protein